MRLALLGNSLIQPANLIVIVFILVTGIWFMSGVATIPFHPDESTQLFMSADWEYLLAQPWSMAWQPETSTLRQTYRLQDAPLCKYILGIARMVTMQAPLPVDWNWSLSWEENRQAGALPDDRLLSAGRMGQAAIFPLSLLLIYMSAARLDGRILGWCAMIFLATNSLVLLHTRRAMAEGGLLFSICLFIAGLVFFKNRPWLIGLLAALAFCAKQSTLPLVAVGFLAVVIYSPRPFFFWRLGKDLVLYSLSWFLLVFLLNPLLWAHPFEALQAAIVSRQDLLARQTNEFFQANPDAVLSSPWLASLSLVGNLFIIHPAIAEVGNYLFNTSNAAQLYLANPINTLFRGMTGGMLLLTLNLVGFGLAARHCLLSHFKQRGALALVMLSGAVLFISFASAITLPFQRYVIPLVPFTCLFAGWSVMKLAHLVVRYQKRRTRIP